MPIDLIEPGTTQARRRFAADALAELAASIRTIGLVQPIVLRTLGRRYELLAGERRWRAAQQAGLHEIPAVIRDDLDDAEAHVLGLVENLQRESLSPIETAEGLRRLGEAQALTHEAIGARIGKSRVYVTNFLRLLSLAPSVQQAIDEGRLSTGHGKVLASLAPGDQLAWSERAQRESLTVRALEKLLARSSAENKAFSSAVDDWQRLANKLSEQLGYPASFTPGRDGAGELKLRFHSLDELDGLLARIGYREA